MLSGYEGYANVGHTYEVTCKYTTEDPTAQLVWLIDGNELDCGTSECTATDTQDSNSVTRFVHPMYILLFYYFTILLFTILPCILMRIKQNYRLFDPYFQIRKHWLLLYSGDFFISVLSL